MIKALSIIDEVAAQTDEVILFHSLSGKDSMALLDMLYGRFKRIVCVYMYVVKDLDHINKYLAFAQERYPDTEWIQVPHYSVFSDIKYGYMGRKKNPKQRLFRLRDITETIREATGIEWACYGFKQSDSMNRRLMLRTYRLNSINDKTKKFYPLSEYKNGDVLEYIHDKNIMQPERYGKEQSAGCDVSDINYLLWLKRNSPSDLAKILSVYPFAERLIFEHEYETIKNERNKDNQENAD